MMRDHPHNHSIERCRVLIAQLNDYLDGELPPDLCAELDTLGKTVQIVRTLDLARPTLPPDVEARLLARLALSQAPQPAAMSDADPINRRG